MDEFEPTTPPPPERPPAPDPGGEPIDWSLTTWKGSRLQQHRAFYALPLRHKLEIIGEMCDHARRTVEWRRQRGLPYIDLYTGEVIRPDPPPGATNLEPSADQPG